MKLLIIFMLFPLVAFCDVSEFGAGTNDCYDSYGYSAASGVNYGTDIYLYLRDDNTTTGSHRVFIDGWPGVRSTIYNREVLACTLWVNYMADGSPTLEFNVSGLRRNVVESEVTWASASSGVSWTSGGANDVTNDRYADTLDKAFCGDTNSTGWYALDVTEYMQLCDGPDTANFCGFVLYVTQNGSYSRVWLHSSEHSITAQRPKLTIVHGPMGAHRNYYYNMYMFRNILDYNKKIRR